MAAPVVVRFAVEGLDNIQKAFRNVEDAVSRSERNAMRDTQRASRERVANADKEVREKQRILDKESREEARVRRELARETDRSARAATASDAREARERTRIVEREARDKVAEMKNADRMVVQAKKEAAREVASAEAEQNREAMRWVRQRQREQRQEGMTRSDRLGMLGTGVSKVAQSAIGLVGTAMSLGGGFSVADALHTRMSAQGMAADIANNGYMPYKGQKAENMVKRSSAEVLQTATTAGTQYGFDQEATLKGLDAFVSKTGDLDMGQKSLKQLAELARATGSNFEDLSNAAAEVFNSDTNQSADQLMKTMRGLAGQGQVGAVDMKNLAGGAAAITAGAGRFGGNKAENINVLGAIAQEAKARGGAKTADQALNSVSSFSNVFSKNARLNAFNDMGVKLRDKDANLLSPQEIIKSSIVAADKKGGPKDFDRNMGKMFMDVNARRATMGFEQIYKEAGRGESGEKAIDKEFERLKEATMTEAQVKDAAAQRMAEVDMQFTKAILEMKESVTKNLMPALTPLIPAFEKLTPLLGEAAKAFAWTADKIMKIADPFGDENKKKKNTYDDVANAEAIKVRIRRGVATPEDIKEGIELQGKLKSGLDSQKNDLAHPGFFRAVTNTPEEIESEDASKKRGITDTETTLHDLTAALKKVTDAANKAADAHDNVAGVVAPNSPSRTTTMAQIPNMSGGAQQK